LCPAEPQDPVEIPEHKVDIASHPRQFVPFLTHRIHAHRQMAQAASHDACQPAVRQSEAEIGADVAIEPALGCYGTEPWQLGMHERIADVVKRDRRLVSGKLVHYCLELGPRHAPRKRLLSQNSGLVDGRPRVHAIGTAKIAHREMSGDLLGNATKLLSRGPQYVGASTPPRYWRCSGSLE
jgi:hypothetical protein